MSATWSEGKKSGVKVRMEEVGKGKGKGKGEERGEERREEREERREKE
jgi:hypothetical protein